MFKIYVYQCYTIVMIVNYFHIVKSPQVAFNVGDYFSRSGKLCISVFCFRLATRIQRILLIFFHRKHLKLLIFYQRINKDILSKIIYTCIHHVFIIVLYHTKTGKDKEIICKRIHSTTIVKHYIKLS